MVAPRGYLPNRGDVVWIELTPQSGHEQAGRRPALVLSPKVYNGKTGLLIACPITSREKGYPFEVKLPLDCEVSGVVLSDQVKSLDWRTRKARFICRVSQDVIDETRSKMLAILA